MSLGVQSLLFNKDRGLAPLEERKIGRIIIRIVPSRGVFRKRNEEGGAFSLEVMRLAVKYPSEAFL